MGCDYRKMLLAYLELVGQCEGVDFLGGGPACKIDDEFTDDEAIELAKLRDLGRNWQSRYYNDAGEPMTAEDRKALQDAEKRHWQIVNLRDTERRLKRDLIVAQEANADSHVERCRAALARVSADLAEIEATG